MVNKTPACDATVHPWTATVNRVPIWDNGRQRPPFDPGAWARISTIMAKTSLIAEIADAVARLDRL